jgi:hypothetical protein
VIPGNCHPFDDFASAASLWGWTVYDLLQSRNDFMQLPNGKPHTKYQVDNGGPLWVVLDCYSFHREEVIMAHADELGIHFLLIPAGLPDRLRGIPNQKLAPEVPDTQKRSRNVIQMATTNTKHGLEFSIKPVRRIAHFLNKKFDPRHRFRAVAASRRQNLHCVMMANIW